ncbi:MAG: hypothetical protein Q8L14_34950 [Myxococcales bacterium]|nr:hypothetical protein [Myxococcales bacterium]
MLGVLLAGGDARAESAEAQAKRIAMEGKKAFDTGDFMTAISRYEAAYKLKAAPGLLFNLGQCHRKTGNLEASLSYFKRYLETNPPTPQAAATEQVVAEVKAQLDAEREKERAAEERRRTEEAARQDELRVIAARAEADAAAKKLQLELTRRELPPPPPITSRWWFWAGIAGVVVAGAVTATAVATAPGPTPTTFPDINAR